MATDLNKSTSDRNIYEAMYSVASRSSIQIEEIVVLASNHLDEHRRDEIVKCASMIIYEIRQELIGRLFSFCPDLQIDAEARMEKMGRSYF